MFQPSVCAGEKVKSESLSSAFLAQNQFQIILGLQKNESCSQKKIIFF